MMTPGERIEARRKLIDMVMDTVGEERLYASGWRVSWRGDEPVIETDGFGREFSIGQDGRLWCRISGGGMVTHAVVSDDGTINPIATGVLGNATNN